MPKQIITLLSVGGLYFALILLLRNFFSLEHLAFVVGGLVGIYVPYLDSVIYVYALRPHEVSSQRVANMVAQSKIGQAAEFISRTNSERSKLVFHSALFQSIFAIFAFFVMSSSSNQLGRGLVLVFLLHYVVLQGSELVKGHTLSGWFSDLHISLTQQASLFYWLIHFGFVVLLGL